MACWYFNHSDYLGADKNCIFRLLDYCMMAATIMQDAATLSVHLILNFILMTLFDKKNISNFYFEVMSLPNFF